MIKILRDASHNYPWLIKSIMGILALVFVVTMGWWGFDEKAGNAVADVGDLSVSRDEFKRAFEFMYRSYREKGAGEIKEEAFKQIVIDQLIESRLWVIAARDMGLTVSDTDLRDTIIQIPDFQKNGAFDPDLYRRLLAANHWTPSAFEAMQQQEILAGKARLIVRDSVALTPWEIAEGQALTPKPQDPNSPMTKDRALQDMLFQKQQRALAAYQEALKAKIPTKIHRELL
ncbi:MAG: SurA N-terminal domain-containing protein [Nitrospiraceae bacterium]|jgi:peptidyl-prolyl cis-trans isomerase D|uniref:SurA N-terminal domain-containing protein n=1 Tax=Nitrospira cf. moscoviensis SBR1015 TaxID=96242 RepID=UPI000A09C275|nr:SurA N-terminal domain-containing protein [Nitrospira cf. moscoviensis SBR1015]MBY0247252.1 SurA N-terminal domain-containing protein [Nitrospiraceae bacterium]OQW36699.1 MAG: hypothetical protein A4E20_06345 [Nitrospira sp. SG-bin2]